MASYIRIPEPCNESWEEMLPAEHGKHCLKCCKTVVDFTDWEIPAIVEYMKENAKKNVCGHFNNTSVETSQDYLVRQVSFSNISIFKKIAAIFLIAFGMAGSSCMMGKPAPVENMDDSTAIPVMIDSTTLSVTTGVVIMDADSIAPSKDSLIP
ncbi:hypothetical protein SAMN05518672_107189 [Chitinophaga sp. CF118]|uniref:hypothetical protein n=1 Tax=Chitinophaga sp. CF118 TaxID=1884367 RepID=UPI0008EDDDA1|nr:hypothetical protein [Chitinophaga sp. CF118]SFE55387.1 hypothetical protein SAMN05518672_107189 [Chitinophaga sp. CF118]